MKNTYIGLITGTALAAAAGVIIFAWFKGKNYDKDWTSSSVNPIQRRKPLQTIREDENEAILDGYNSDDYDFNEGDKQSGGSRKRTRTNIKRQSKKRKNKRSKSTKRRHHSRQSSKKKK